MIPSDLYFYNGVYTRYLFEHKKSNGENDIDPTNSY